MSQWKEIENLSNYFKKLQDDAQINKLSEPNCIEIVNKLLLRKEIDLIYTTDGKEFVTPKYLIQEIKEELALNGGRINIVDLSLNLKLNLNHIQSAVEEILKQASSYKFILGQLIDKQYEQNVADEINQKLLHLGIVNINELAKTYDLPGEYLNNIVKDNLNKLISGHFDDETKTLYTEQYINGQKCILRGILVAATSPLTLDFVVNNYVLNEKLITNIIEQLISSHEVQGVLQGNKRDKLSFIKFVPTVFINLQKDWMLSTYRQNKYIEYEACYKLNIYDPKAFFVKLQKENQNASHNVSQPVFLKDCCIHPSILETVMSDIENNLTNHHFCDVLEILPPYLTSEADLKEIVQLFKKTPFASKYQLVDDPSFLFETFGSANPHSNKNDDSSLLFVQDESIIIGKKLLLTYVSAFNEQISKRAKENFQSNTPQLIFDESWNGDAPLKAAKDASMFEEDLDKSAISRKEERKRKSNATPTSKKDTGGGGGSARSREVKTKGSSKKTYMPQSKGTHPTHQRRTDQDDIKEYAISPDEISNTLMLRLREIYSETNSATFEESRLKIVADEIASILVEPINQTYVEECKKLYLTSMTSKRHDIKRELEKYQDQINDLYHRLTIFSKGIQLFNDDRVKEDLIKYLFRTIGCELFVALLDYSKLHQGGNSNLTKGDVPNTLANTLITVEARKKATNDIASDIVKSTLLKISKILTQNDSNALLDELYTISQTNSLNIMLKKMDKKKEKTLVQTYHKELIDKLQGLWPTLNGEISTDQTNGSCVSITNQPLKFHLITLILFTGLNKSALHASGKFVPDLIDNLNMSPTLSTDIKQLLSECQKIIIANYSNQQHVPPTQNIGALPNGDTSNPSSGDFNDSSANSHQIKVLDEKLTSLKNLVLEMEKI